MKIRLLALLLLALAAAPAAWAETYEVMMTTRDFEPQFVPASITIEPGDTVRWINVDPFFLEHRVSSGTGAADPQAGEIFDSFTVTANDSFEFTFEEEGDFEYFSPPHEFAGMFGVIHVTNDTPVESAIQTQTWGYVKAVFGQLLPRP